MQQKCWVTFYFAMIIQVYICGSSTLHTYDDTLIKKLTNLDTSYRAENIRQTMHGSPRHKREIGDYRFLRELERNPTLSGDNLRRLESIIVKNEPLKELYKNSRDWARSSDYEIDLKKEIIENNYQHNDIKKFNEQFGLLSHLDLPNDVKHYIFNKYLSKLVFSDDKKLPKAEKIIREHTRTYDILEKPDFRISEDVYSIIDNYDDKHLENTSQYNLYFEDLPSTHSSDGLEKDIHSKRMINEEEYIETDKVHENSPSRQPKNEDDEFFDGERNIHSITEVPHDSIHLVIDLRDGSVKSKEKYKILKNQNDQKSGKQKNDIKIVIKQDSNFKNTDGTPNTPSDIKIVIKLPDQQTNENKHIDEIQRIMGTDTKHDVREEIKKYISLALALLRKMEDDNDNSTSHQNRHDFKTSADDEN